VVIRRLILIGVFVVLVIYNFSVFFGQQSKKGIEPPLVKNEQPIKTSFHENGYENAWIKEVNQKQLLIKVKTVDSKIEIYFRPEPEYMKRFHENWIAPVTFDCGQKPNEECDPSKPYKLYVSNVLVEPVEVSR